MSFYGDILFLSLGTYCNNNCYFCVVDNKNNFHYLSEEVAKKMIVNASNRGVKNIVFSGGESTLRKCLPRLISLAVVADFISIQVQTNGRTLSDITLVEHYQSLGVTEYSISLHGDSPKVHDKITGIENSFSETIQGIKNIRSVYGNKSIIATNTVIVYDNLNHLSRIVKLLISLGVPYIQLAYIHGQGRASNIYYQITPTMSEAQKEVLKALDTAKTLGYSEGFVTIEAYPYCFLIDREGFSSDITIPNSFVLSQSRDSLEPFIFDGPRKKAPQCCHCNFDYICHGVWRDYIENYGTEEFHPITDRKPAECIPLELLELNKLINDGGGS